MNNIKKINSVYESLTRLYLDVYNHKNSEGINDDYCLNKLLCEIPIFLDMVSDVMERELEKTE